MDDGTIRLDCETYRGDLAYVRKALALNRSGPDMCVRLEGAIPHTPRRDWIDVYLRRRDVYLVGLRNGRVAIKFQDTSPRVSGVAFARTLPFSPNYTILGAWSEGFAYSGPAQFHNAVATLAAVGKDTTFGPAAARALILAIFAVSEALRFWTIDRAIEQALCQRAGARPFRFVDWKDLVNNWDRLSKGDQQGALQGVILPSL